MSMFSRSSNTHRPPKRHPRWALSEETVLLLASLFIAITANGGFMAGALKGRQTTEVGAWGLGLALGVALVCIHYLLMAALAHRWTFKPVLSVALVVAALASHYVSQYNVYLDPSMLRNVLRTDVTEARELIGLHLLAPLLLQAALPLAVLWWLPVKPRTWLRAINWRLGSLLLAAGVLLAAVLSAFQPLASLMRNQKELRYLITPANVVWSLASVAGFAARQASGPKKPIGLDAKLSPAWATRDKPTLLVLVVGETARAANWGLSGYRGLPARQTTPELAKLPVLNFPYADACGTNTEVSLPCMFAPVGRRDYDEATIRGSETLLHVLARAGVGVNWVDNQSGCKGVCDGLPNTSVQALAPPGLCESGRCLDEGLLHALPGSLTAATTQKNKPQLLVLHMLGNHGPSYFRRVPPAFKRFVPICESDDLRLCSIEQIVNAYDNALLYTDHVLAQLIKQLQAAAGQVDSAVVYVSDHGESLGENNLFLHGIPYAIAPDVQTKVPLVMWFSAGYGASLGIDMACLAQRAKQPASHDHLFHSLLGLLDVQTALLEKRLDLTNPCRVTAAKP
jgi:lipid A ethanolaminephosphotransferase